MAVNPYFKKDYSGEQDVLEDLTIELIKTMGRDMYYIPRNILEENKLFGEGTRVNYTTGIPLEMYIDSVSGFDGQGDIASKFGIEIKDNINLTISKKRFVQEIVSKLPSIIRPREGDLIYFPLANALFEINFVEHENPFYQFGKLYSYKLTCELFVYNEEEINTGNTDIDEVATDNKEFSLGLTLSNVLGQTQGFFIGETVYQIRGTTNINEADLADADITAIISFAGTTGSAYLNNIQGNIILDNNTYIFGDTSKLAFKNTNLGITTDKLVIINKQDNTPASDNENLDLEKKIQNIFDYTETDPFSEGNY